MTIAKSTMRFSLGSLYITAGAKESIPAKEVFAAIGRHLRCDWGDVGEQDWMLNDEACAGIGRLLSSYRTTSGIRFWIITDYGHEVTTILLPSEY